MLNKLWLRLGVVMRKPYIAVAVVVFFVSLLSFGIGYLVAKEWGHAPIIIENLETRK